MTRGPEAYLQMWERAIGIAPDPCRADVDDLTQADLDRLEQGMSPERVLRTLGQPSSRQNSTFTYCTSQGMATLTFEGDRLSSWSGSSPTPSASPSPTPTKPGKGHGNGNGHGKGGSKG